MSVPQYLRKASLITGDESGKALDLSELRFRFSIRRGDTQTPNSADIRVYNLSRDTANRVKKEFTRVVIQAGYEGNYGVIFDGTIKQVRFGRESQVDTYLDITAADGDRAYNFSMTAVSLAAGQTAPNNAVQYIIKDMATHGVTQGYIPDLPGNPLPRGKVIYGMTRDALRSLAQNTDTNWSIQDGKVNMIPLTAYMPGDVPVITAATGMIGLPEQTPNGIKVRVLLNPTIKIGQAIQLDNKSIQQMRYGLGVNQQQENFFNELASKLNDDGFYYVMVADHTGDTRGNDWYSDLTCLAIDATVVPYSQLDKMAPPGNEYIDIIGGKNKVGSVKRFG